MLVVYTLGNNPEAAAEIERLIGTWEYVLRERPTRGNASVELQARVRGVLSSVNAVTLDSTTGYVRVSASTIYSLSRAIQELESAGVSLSDVIFQVQDPTVGRG